MAQEQSVLIIYSSQDIDQNPLLEANIRKQFSSEHIILDNKMNSEFKQDLFLRK